MFTILKFMNIRLFFSQCSRSLLNIPRVADPLYSHSIIWYQFLMYCLRVHSVYLCNSVKGSAGTDGGGQVRARAHHCTHAGAPRQDPTLSLVGWQQVLIKAWQQ